MIILYLSICQNLIYKNNHIYCSLIHKTRTYTYKNKEQGNSFTDNFKILIPKVQLQRTKFVESIQNIDCLATG